MALFIEKKETILKLQEIMNIKLKAVYKFHTVVSYVSFEGNPVGWNPSLQITFAKLLQIKNKEDDFHFIAFCFLIKFR